MCLIDRLCALAYWLKTWQRYLPKPQSSNEWCAKFRQPDMQGLSLDHLYLRLRHHISSSVQLQTHLNQAIRNTSTWYIQECLEMFEKQEKYSPSREFGGSVWETPPCPLHSTWGNSDSMWSSLKRYSWNLASCTLVIMWCFIEVLQINHSST